MGGTNIYEPLLSIFNQPLFEGLPRNIYLLTDGAVSNTADVVSLISKHNSHARVHTFGIGDGVSTELIKDSATAGLGHYSFINNPIEIERKVIEAL